MLYQDPFDFPELTVLENFILGQAQGIRLEEKDYENRLRALAEGLNFNLHPHFPVKTLTIGERQQLELLRLLSLGSRVLILDEPTTGISSEQKEILFQALKKLVCEGKSIILVSHKLEDVEALCDHVTVLRNGRVAGEMKKPFNANGLLEMMFGVPPALPSRSGLAPGEPVLSLNRISATGGRTGLHDCHAVIHRGEVVGLAGLEGSGQGVFLRVAAGLKQPSRGEVRLLGKKMNGRDYHGFKSAGVAFLPGTRLEEGLITGLNIAEHFSLQDRYKRFIIRRKYAFETATKRIQTFRIKGTAYSDVEALSGGNQQRLLLSFLPPAPLLLLLENPTRGLDMDSVHWVWQHLHLLSKEKCAIVFSSPELDEILMVADRVLVFFNGAITLDVKADETDIQGLGRAIAGKI
jgi:simple sugar transport system ATP-binding protein